MQGGWGLREDGRPPPERAKFLQNKGEREEGGGRGKSAGTPRDPERRLTGPRAGKVGPRGLRAGEPRTRGRGGLHPPLPPLKFPVGRWSSGDGPRDPFGFIVPPELPPLSQPPAPLLRSVRWDNYLLSLSFHSYLPFFIRRACVCVRACVCLRAHTH